MNLADVFSQQSHRGELPAHEDKGDGKEREYAVCAPVFVVDPRHDEDDDAENNPEKGDEEAEEGGRHPTLQGWHYSFEDYGNNRHQGKTDYIQLFTRREYSTKQKITYFSIYGYTDSFRFTSGIGMEYSSL